MASTDVLLYPSPVISSATGILALLDEDDNVLKAHALKQLDAVVDQFWAEVADAVPLIEGLAEDESFPDRELAAYVASKCFFHLEEYSDALRLALGAGNLFDIKSSSPFVETLIATCIDEYTALKVAAYDNGESVKIDPRMEDIVEKMFSRCYEAGAFSQALGIALEARRLDKVEEVFNRSSDLSSTLSYCFQVCRSVVSQREFRLKVTEVMVKMYQSLRDPEYPNLCQCLQILNNYSEVAKILENLLRKSTGDALVAYQIAFDLYENENQKFLIDVLSSLPTAPKRADTEESKEEKSVETISAPAGAQEDYWLRLDQLKSILSGSFSVDLILDFLYRQSNSDALLMKQTKTAIENRNAVLHNAAVVSHSYMNMGTTVDKFLRDNLDWMGRATNWAKFTATASLGVVHKGHVKQSMNLLQPYLPQGGVSTSPYSEGGALYALGLIHANQGAAGSADTIIYLRNALKNSGTEEAVQHGACLGIGLCAMGTHDFEVYEELKNILFTDSAVAGEAAGYSIGLLMLGAGSSSDRCGGIVKELLSYAHDTKHEKIIQGAVMAIALMMYGREEEADSLIEQLIRDKDPLIRYGGMYTIAMAYCGTANNSAVRRLLHVAVSDVSDDVRRGAVTCLGFILFRTPEQVPKLVSLLSESFNPHVRYGSCMAVGIACAGTSKNEAIQLLKPMMDDPVDFVRQGATIAVSMVVMQEAEGKNSQIKPIVEKISKVVNDKYHTTMTKMGGILAQGILNAGGRNVVISLQSHNGFAKMPAVVGLAVWAQHWYWYPFMHFLELACQSTCFIGLNKDLKMPKGFTVKCNAKPSMFAYAKHLEEKKEEKKELVATAVLSTTAKAKARHEKKEAKEKKSQVKEEKAKKEDAMEVDSKGEEKKEDSADVVPKKDVKERSTFEVTNPGRITLGQESFVSFNLDQRYVPVVTGRRAAGIIMLKDTQPEEPEDVLQVEAPSAVGDDEEECDPPEPFEWEAPKDDN